MVFRIKAQVDSYICAVVHMTDSKAIQGATLAGVELDSLARGKWPETGVTVAYMAMCVVLCRRVLGKV